MLGGLKPEGNHNDSQQEEKRGGAFLLDIKTYYEVTMCQQCGMHNPWTQTIVQGRPGEGVGVRRRLMGEEGGFSTIKTHS